MAPKEKGTAPGGASMLVLALLKDQEMYGYQIIEELEKRSNNVFQMKEGTRRAHPPLLPHHLLRPQGAGGA